MTLSLARALVKPLHLLLVTSKGGFIGAELTVHATGASFAVIGYAVEADPQFVDTGRFALEVAWIKRELIVEVETGPLLLESIPHSTVEAFNYGGLTSWRARLRIDLSDVDIESLSV